MYTKLLCIINESIFFRNYPYHFMCKCYIKAIFYMYLLRHWDLLVAPSCRVVLAKSQGKQLSCHLAGWYVPNGHKRQVFDPASRYSPGSHAAVITWVTLGVLNKNIERGLWWYPLVNYFDGGGSLTKQFLLMAHPSSW